MNLKRLIVTSAISCTLILSTGCTTNKVSHASDDTKASAPVSKPTNDNSTTKETNENNTKEETKTEVKPSVKQEVKQTVTKPTVERAPQKKNEVKHIVNKPIQKVEPVAKPTPTPKPAVTPAPSNNVQDDSKAVLRHIPHSCTPEGMAQEKAYNEAHKNDAINEGAGENEGEPLVGTD